MPGKKTSLKSKAVKKKNKRSREKYPALKPELNLRSRFELIDYDYVDKLNDEEKAWLNKFTNEYTNASLDRKNLKNNFHNTEELKKDCYDRNNARNRDVLTRAKASGNNVYLDDIKEKDIKVKNYLGEETDNLNDTSTNRKKNT